MTERLAPAREGDRRDEDEEQDGKEERGREDTHGSTSIRHAPAVISGPPLSAGAPNRRHGIIPNRTSRALICRLQAP